MDLGALFDVAMATVVLTFFFIVVFDNTGTLLAVARAAGMMQPDGSVPRLERALVVDSTAAMAGAALGTSTTTSYIESAAGVNAGGRTGLVAVTVAVLFLATLFLAPLAASIPAFATAPALVFVGCLMMSAAKDIAFDDATEYVPAAITIISMPLTFSIADGIAFGFIAYAGIKLLAGRWAELRPAVAVLAVAVHPQVCAALSDVAIGSVEQNTLRGGSTSKRTTTGERNGRSHRERRRCGSGRGDRRTQAGAPPEVLAACRADLAGLRRHMRRRVLRRPPWLADAACRPPFRSTTPTAIRHRSRRLRPEPKRYSTFSSSRRRSW